MDHQVHYAKLMKRGSRLRRGYIEKHHVLPRCLGGTNKKSNIVYLTPEEHYVAHQLLVKMYPGHTGLVYAAFMMTWSNERLKHQGNKLYGWLRRRMSAARKGKSLSAEHRANLSIAHMGHVHTAEHRANISRGGKGLKRSKKTCRKISKALRGKKRGPMSAENRAKISAAVTGVKRSAAFCAAISARQIGKRPPHSKAIEAKRLASIRRAVWPAEHRAKCSKRFKLLNASRTGKSLSAKHKAVLVKAQRLRRLRERQNQVSATSSAVRQT